MKRPSQTIAMIRLVILIALFFGVDPSAGPEVGPDGQKHESFEPSDLLESVVRERYSPPSFTPWLEHTDIRDLPIVPDDRPR